MDTKIINRNFTYHAPHGDQTASFELLRSAARGLAVTIQGECPESREKSLAFTKLEECVMWANAAIVRNETEGGDQ